jgi:methyl-accepting chemotaxis protein
MATETRSGGSSLLRRLNLRAKLILFICPPLVVGFCVSWVVATAAARRGMTAAAVAGLSTEAKGLAHGVTAMFDDSMSDARMLARLDVTAATIENHDPKAFRWIADQMVLSKKRYAAVIVADAAGQIVAANVADRRGPGSASLEKRSIAQEAWAIIKGRSAGKESEAVPPGRPGFLSDRLGPRETVAGFHLVVRDVMDDVIGTVTLLVSLDAAGSVLDGALSASEGVPSSLALVVGPDGLPVVFPDKLGDVELWRSSRIDVPSTPDAARSGWTGPGHSEFMLLAEPVEGAAASWRWRLVSFKAMATVEAPVSRLSRNLTLVFALCAALLCLLLALIAARFAAPLRRLLVAATGAEGGGRLATIEVESEDEVGQLTMAFNDMVRALNTDLERQMRSISRNAEHLLRSASQLNNTSQLMTRSSHATSEQAATAGRSIESFAQSMRTVHDGARSMNESVSYVAEHAHGTRTAVEEAVRAAANATSVMNNLQVSSGEIEGVLKVISSVANQTKLLALNATIEASRAGEAGRGFSVVAQEVKDLARRVQSSTQDIASKVESMRADTERAMIAVGAFNKVMAGVNDISQSLSSTAEEQLATTREIFSHVESASTAAATASANVGSLVDSADQTTRGASETGQAAAELLKMAADLQGLTNSGGRLAASSEPSGEESSLAAVTSFHTAA